MNNFRKHCAFIIIAFAHWRPQEGGKSTRSPPWKSQNYGYFSPCEVPLFSFNLWGGGLVFPFGGHFLHVRGGGGGVVSLCGKIFRLVPTCKIFFGARSLDARVVTNMAPWGN